MATTPPLPTHWSLTAYPNLRLGSTSIFFHQNDHKWCRIDQLEGLCHFLFGSVATGNNSWKGVVTISLGKMRVKCMFSKCQYLIPKYLQKILHILSGKWSLTNLAQNMSINIHLEVIPEWNLWLHLRHLVWSSWSNINIRGSDMAINRKTKMWFPLSSKCCSYITFLFFSNLFWSLLQQIN